MSANILSGKSIADAIKAEVAVEVATLREVHGFSPCLVVVRVGEDPASSVYVASKVKTANDLGIISEHLHFADDVSQEEIVSVVEQLNQRSNVDGILVQLPLPRHIDEREILEQIDPEKDVDGFHPINTGRLTQGYPSLAPCTPAGVIEILKRSGIEIAGSHAVIVGRSNIVGKPMAALLLREHATVTICHSRTKNLPEISRSADILVAAIGRAGFIRDAHIGRGSTVIDVGINNISDPERLSEFFDGDELSKRLTAIEKRGFTLVGDVNPKEAMEKAANFTPVPGGVGLLTVAMLMKNTVEATKMRRKLD
ncbi:MAG: bifunctional 5,10-methylenetetrahydrofolate dehydrogenase/5,10-methenyltetrahydrofolate cyclohydrolase [Pyrinomonadaceae bacterium]